MALGDPLDQAMTFLRNTAAGSPRFGDQWEVLSIDTEPHRRDRLHLHLSNGANIRLTVSVDVPPVLTPSPEFPPGHPRSTWPTVELADGPDLPAAIDEVYSTACHECGAAVGHLCEAREDAATLPERTPHIARVLATTILDCAWQEPTAHPALQARWEAAQQSYEDYLSDEPGQHGIPDGLSREQYAAFIAADRPE